MGAQVRAGAPHAQPAENERRLAVIAEEEIATAIQCAKTGCSLAKDGAV